MMTMVAVIIVVVIVIIVIILVKGVRKAVAQVVERFPDLSSAVGSNPIVVAPVHSGNNAGESIQHVIGIALVSGGLGRFGVTEQSLLMLFAQATGASDKIVVFEIPNFLEQIAEIAILSA